MEALVNLCTNKQYPTPVWCVPDGHQYPYKVMNALLFPCASENLPDFPFKDKSENTFINMFVPRDNTKIVNVFHSLVGYYENTGAENTGAGGKRTGGRF